MTIKKTLAYALAAVLSFATVAPAFAHGRNDDRRGDTRRDNDRRGDRRDDRRDNDRRGGREWNGPPRADWNWRGDRRWDGGARHRVMVRRPPPYAYYRPYPVARNRWYQNVYVYRPYGVAYPGFGFYYRDNDAARFLGLTALSFVALNALNESQQRAHEQAMIEAANARIGDSIDWEEGGRSGTVTAVRDGQTADGRQCREFQQTVTIGGNKEEAYGTACMQPDGTWQVVNQNN